jgi:Short C-terminal domain/Phospholipase_D-nuclease N-terminal
VTETPCLNDHLHLLDRSGSAAIRPGPDVRGSPCPPLEKGFGMLLVAADYPFLDVLWTIIIFFAWVIFIWVAITVLIDVFRRHDISGWGKAGWVILVIVLPFLGVLIYLLANHEGMAERSAKEAKATQAEFDEYVRKAAGSGGPAAEIEKARQLLDSGAITQEEFDAIKQKALS